MFMKVTTSEKEVFLSYYVTNHLTAYTETDHRLIEILEVMKMMKGSKKNTITFTERGEQIMFLNVMTPEWWTDDMVPALKTLHDRNKNSMRRHFDSENDYENYLLNKQQILEMQKRLKWEDQLIKEYL